MTPAAYRGRAPIDRGAARRLVRDSCRAIARSLQRRASACSGYRVSVDLGLAGKVFVVTGSTAGIGLEVARQAPPGCSRRHDRTSGRGDRDPPSPRRPRPRRRRGATGLHDSPGHFGRIDGVAQQRRRDRDPHPRRVDRRRLATLLRAQPHDGRTDDAGRAAPPGARRLDRQCRRPRVSDRPLRCRTTR